MDQYMVDFYLELHSHCPDPAMEWTTMGMNIKNQETHRLARELATEMGVSVTAAVTEAVRMMLATLRAAKGDDPETRAQRILELAAEMRQMAPQGYFDQDFDELLYDEMGLPK